MITTIIFLLVLAVLIFVHELGHFVFARWNGIRVDEFKIGFGPRLLSWGKGETKYGLNLIPFGGYVKIHGESPDDESINGSDKHRSFVHKRAWQQIVVLAAGVFFNFVFAWILYSGVFMSGVTADPSGFERYSSDFKNQRVMITQVSPGSPAEKAGLKIGDEIKKTSLVNATVADTSNVSGSSVVKKQTIEEIQNVITSSGGKPITFEYVLAGSANSVNTITTQIEPTQGIVKDKYAIGIAMSDVVDIKLSFISAIYEGGHYTLIMIRETAVGLYNFVANLFRGSASFSDVSGPVGIAGIVGSAAQLGFTYLLMITALISINLGVINLVPFPALDGGRILFVIIESIIRRPLSPKYANAINTVGFVLLMILMVVVTYKDVAKLIK